MKFNIVFITTLLFFIMKGIQAQQAENLGQNINSIIYDNMPFISPDSKTLYFSRYIEISRNADLYYSEINEKGEWCEARDLASLNNQYANAVLGVSADNNKLFLWGNYYISPSKFSITVRNDKGWSIPESIKFINEVHNVDSGGPNGIERYDGMLASDGRTVLLVFDLSPYSYGRLDIYISFISESGSFLSKPLNLGNNINKKGDDSSPFLANDMRTLYFCSDRPGGFGGSDLYMSKRLDDTWKNWTEPVNLGELINTENDETSLSIPYNGEYAYFSSNKEGFGKMDIFRIKLPEKVRPDRTVLIKGRTLVSTTGKPAGAKIYYESLTGKKLSGSLLSTSSGIYNIILPAGDIYGFFAAAKGYYSVSENIDLTQFEESEIMERDIYLIPLEVNAKVKLNNIFFETGSSDLQTTSYPELDRLMALLKDNPTMKIEISGHTDSAGTEETNLKLSEARAAVVVKHLISKGVEKGRIPYKGCGSSDPVAGNNDPEGRRLNRRVEFIILKK